MESQDQEAVENCWCHTCNARITANIDESSGELQCAQCGESFVEVLEDDGDISPPSATWNNQDNEASSEEQTTASTGSGASRGAGGDGPAGGQGQGQGQGGEAGSGSLAEALPCVVYLHGNSSCRLDVLRSGVLSTVAIIGYSLVSFDFSGSGLSDGDYVSLGYYEKDDIDDVVRFITTSGWASKVVLWGRSMGAASALLYTATHGGNVSALVLDSPFSSLSTVALDLVENSKLQAPGFLVKGFLQFLRMSVRNRANFDISELEVEQEAQRCTVSALFLTAQQDRMVLPYHSIALCQAYGGLSQRLEFVGSHNSHRPSLALKAIAIFARTAIEAPHRVSSAFRTIDQLFGGTSEIYEPTPYNPRPDSSWMGIFGQKPSRSASTGRNTSRMRELSRQRGGGSLRPQSSVLQTSLENRGTLQRSCSISKLQQSGGTGPVFRKQLDLLAQDAEDEVLEELFTKAVAICALEEWYHMGRKRVVDSVVGQVEDRLLDELVIMACAHCRISQDADDTRLYQSSEEHRKFLLSMRAAEEAADHWGHEEFDVSYWAKDDWTVYEGLGVMRLFKAVGAWHGRVLGGMSAGTNTSPREPWEDSPPLGPKASEPSRLASRSGAPMTTSAMLRQASGGKESAPNGAR
uniref:Serine aminopeptidase S33 domain-containing protein n=1 Tax=Fibrocapsa japonica TaxID=94617 RepID=A0A7S2XUR6_9STRA|mmetsp:Transcript_13767/g.20271  ORF Transcript_13767/g.20271 Transcript_13767/m.20271 type:complete len:635 (+) Transcript_13767:125-2029(+)